MYVLGGWVGYNALSARKALAQRGKLSGEVSAILCASRVRKGFNGVLGGGHTPGLNPECGAARQALTLPREGYLLPGGCGSAILAPPKSIILGILIVPGLVGKLPICV